MIEPVTVQDSYPRGLTVEAIVRDWKSTLGAELDRAVVQGGGRWSRALMAVAWIHLATFPRLPVPSRSAGRA